LVFIPCGNGGAGDVVDLEGVSHSLFQITNDGAGGFHVTQLSDLQGVTGVGNSGATYRGTGATLSQFDTKVGETRSSVNNFRVIGEGLASNVLLHATFHVTINANGVLTVYVNNFSLDCT